ncbi:MAG: hypothetical protein QXG03_10780 [Halalkalicoccus sp.]
MRYSTTDGDEIRVFTTVGEIDDDPDERVAFEELTVSVHQNEIEGRIESPTDDGAIADLARSSRPARVEVEPADSTETRVIEARVQNPAGELEITDVQSV